MTQIAWTAFARDGRQFGPCLTDEEKAMILLDANTVNEIRVGEKYNLWAIYDSREIWIKVLKRLEGISYAFSIAETDPAW